MKVVSIDVGIKNMAYCVLSSTVEPSTHPKVEIWDIMNVAEETPSKCIHCIKVTPAKFKKNEKFYCLKHAKGEKQYTIPTTELTHAHINKQKIAQLILLAEKYKIKYDKEHMKKPDLVSLFHKYIEDTCFEKSAQVNASNVDLITVGRNIQKKFDAAFDSISHEITHVVIENQISPIANRMKTIQGMVAQYFIMKNPSIMIEFVSSSNKLKTVATSAVAVSSEEEEEEAEEATDQDEETATTKTNTNTKTKKLDYAGRKKKGVSICLELLKDDHAITSYLKTHKKKDDLAGAFLQGIWYMDKNK